MSTAQPKAITCDHACGQRPVAVEDRSPGVLDSVVAIAYGMFFVVLAVAGSLWIVADLSAALIPRQHVH